MGELEEGEFRGGAGAVGELDDDALRAAAEVRIPDARARAAREFDAEKTIRAVHRAEAFLVALEDMAEAGGQRPRLGAAVALRAVAGEHQVGLAIGGPEVRRCQERANQEREEHCGRDAIGDRMPRFGCGREHGRGQGHGTGLHRTRFSGQLSNQADGAGSVASRRTRRSRNAALAGSTASRMSITR